MSFHQNIRQSIINRLRTPQVTTTLNYLPFMPPRQVPSQYFHPPFVSYFHYRHTCFFTAFRHSGVPCHAAFAQVSSDDATTHHILPRISFFFCLPPFFLFSCWYTGCSHCPFSLNVTSQAFIALHIIGEEPSCPPFFRHASNNSVSLN